jgi:hypothetical protein
MGIAPAHKIDKWLAAAGKSAHVSPEVRERVIVAAQFIENSARLADASPYLRGIDFSKPVRVCNRLPDGVYVQFVDHHLGSWFTSTGLTPSQVGLARGDRDQRRFRPAGAVAALESTASSVKDFWSGGRRQESVDPRSGKVGEMTAGGGVQYLVINRFQMQEI